MKIVIITNIILGKHIIEFLKKKFFKKKENQLSGIISGYKFMNSDYFEFSKYKNKRTKVIKTQNINSKKTQNFLEKINPDILLVLGWSQLLNKKILKVPKICSIGYHPSDLPKNRGRHPIIWSIFLGLSKIYSTFFFMNETADGGRIISKKRISLEKNISSKNLLNKIYRTAPLQLLYILNQLYKKKIRNYNKKKLSGNTWRKRTSLDGMVDWRMSGNAIIRLVNCLSEPYPNAEFKFKNKYIKIIKCKFIKNRSSFDYEPGKIIKVNSKYLIKCYDGFIRLDKIKPNIKFNNIQYL